MDNQTKGALAEALVISAFVGKGCQVFLPVLTAPKYDLIADLDGTLLKIQVKYCSKDKLDARGGRHFKWYSPHKFDYFAVVQPKLRAPGHHIYLIPAQNVCSKFSLTTERKLAYLIFDQIERIRAK